MLEFLGAGVTQRNNLTDGVVRSLVSLVLEEGLTPGDRLPSERELMKRLSVGRSSLREAIRALVALGIVEVVPGSGTYVARGESAALARPLSWSLLMSERSTRDVIDTRRAVEVELAGLAAERATPADLARIHECLRLMQICDGDEAAFVRYDLAFHLAIAQGAHSQVLYHVLDTLRHILRVWFHEVAPQSATIEERIARHAAIDETIRSRDVARARELMAAHLDSGAQWLLQAVGSAIGRRQSQVAVDPNELPRPAQQDNLLAHLLPGRGRQSCAEQLDPHYLVAERLGNAGEELSGADEHLEIARLVPDDVGELGTRPEHPAKLGEVAGHAAEVELRDAGIEALEA
jgi:DNA-binding FadR family transcriptional regulator